MPSARSTLTLDDVHAVAAGRCFSTAAEPLVGVELEWLTFENADPWARVEPDRLRRCTSNGSAFPNGSALTFEPGGQLELSTPP
ncbi:MAG: ergothioneine biosynthesis glutamate--cysteine ligase EgtA, partial [Actinomycetota bacterium]|nr:ergothioneine biosynthesis glutamate--cysteine ligase EgtA [Actinomycetota bacterium]